MAQPGAYSGKIHCELIVTVQDVQMSRDGCPARGVTKEVTNHLHQFLLAILMGGDVLARNIGNEGLIPVFVSIQDQANLLFLPLISEVLRSQKNPQFERHVEARQAGHGVRFCAAYVVNAVPALGYDPEDFIYSGLAGVLDFEGTAGRKAACVNAEDQSPQERLIGPVEGAIDKNARSARLGLGHCDAAVTQFDIRSFSPK